MTDHPTNGESHHLFEFEMLKQRYESLEKTLNNVEKEKEYYQVDLILLNLSENYFLFDFFKKIYEQTKKDFEHIEEKYLKAKKLIKELQDRYVLHDLLVSSLLNNSFQGN